MSGHGGIVRDVEGLSDATRGEWTEQFARFAPGFVAHESSRRRRTEEAEETECYSWDRLAGIAGADEEEGVALVMYGHLRDGRDWGRSYSTKVKTIEVTRSRLWARS
ncbi:hypothetical protein BP00DRAFT_414460 [Aspergillus indologenus CBS 114.80]|uniref:Uncharacterized protein n=1 Tax=Aspergillus indologenus CBS 114.80 TaxID=1450541 RepID=A0A2V5IVD2_9EURO|nr:hypothetical protein BP00DRAFT_414460 [Aspergillus indologenus CBS 114.80]